MTRQDFEERLVLAVIAIAAVALVAIYFGFGWTT